LVSHIDAPPEATLVAALKTHETEWHPFTLTSVPENPDEP
jgi:hypothetical protein